MYCLMAVVPTSGSASLVRLDYLEVSRFLLLWLRNSPKTVSSGWSSSYSFVLRCSTNVSRALSACPKPRLLCRNLWP